MSFAPVISRSSNLVLWASLALAIEVSATPVPDTHANAAAFEGVAETYVCIQPLMPLSTTGELDVETAIAAPRFRVGPRLPGRACGVLPLEEVSAKDLPEHVTRLRERGAALQAQMAADADLADCVAAASEFDGEPPGHPGQTLCGWTWTAVAAAPLPSSDGRWAGWLPDRTAIDAQLSWEGENVASGSRGELRLASDWHRAHHQVSLLVTGRYDKAEGSTRRNEQTSRLRWTRDIGSRWFLLSELNLERDQANIASVRFDYLFTRAALGGGLRGDLGQRGEGRIALTANRLHLELLDFDRSISAEAPALYVSAQLALGRRWHLRHWTQLYLWSGGESGLESDSELLFEATRQFGFGLRHALSRNVATVQASDKNESSLFVRFHLP